jgi:acyl carrier protein
MTQTEIYARIQDTLVEKFQIDPKKITPEANLMKDLGMDSLDAIEMAVHIQELTNQRVAEDQLRKLTTVRDVIDMITRMLSAPA